MRRALGVMLRYQPKRVGEALGVLQEAVRHDARDALARYDFAATLVPAWNFPLAWEEYEAAIKLQPFGTLLLNQATLAIRWKGDVTAMRAVLDRLAPGDRAEDRAVHIAMLCGVLERAPDATMAAAAATSRDYLEDSGFAGPKAWFPALAYLRSGKENLARAQWQLAEAVLRERIRTDPKAERYRGQLALTLAWLGRTEEAARELAPLEAAWREQMSPGVARELARHYAACGETVKAVAYLRQAVNQAWFYTDQDMRCDPFLDKVRDTPEFAALLAKLPKQSAPITPVPYSGKAPAVATTASREAEQIVTQVYAMLAKVGYTRENLAVAEEQTRKATELAPGSARAWAARARVQAAYIQRTWDASEKRRQEAQAFAVRALSFDPDEADAMIAQAAVTTAQGSPAQSESILRRAMEVRPTDPLARRLIATALWQQGRTAEALAASLETARLFPDDALAHYDLGNSYTTSRRSEPELALRAFDAALAIEPFGNAILSKVLVLVGAKGDLAAARRMLDQLAPTDRGEDRAVSIAMWLGLLLRDRKSVEAAAALTARTYFEDTYFFGPKAWMVALAQRQDGKEALARVQWQAAETAVRARLQARPDDMREKFRLCITLAWLGRTGEIAAEVATIEGVAKETNNPFLWHAAAVFYAGLGDASKAVPYLRKSLNFRETNTDRTLPLDPWWDKLRGQPEFEALLAEAKARVDAKK